MTWKNIQSVSGTVASPSNCISSNYAMMAVFVVVLHLYILTCFSWRCVFKELPVQWCRNAIKIMFEKTEGVWPWGLILAAVLRGLSGFWLFLHAHTVCLCMHVCVRVCKCVFMGMSERVKEKCKKYGVAKRANFLHPKHFMQPQSRLLFLCMYVSIFVCMFVCAWSFYETLVLVR